MTFSPSLLTLRLAPYLTLTRCSGNEDCLIARLLLLFVIGIVGHGKTRSVMLTPDYWLATLDGNFCVDVDLAIIKSSSLGSKVSLELNFVLRGCYTMSSRESSLDIEALWSEFA